MTLQEFTTLYNARRRETMEIGYFPVKFPLIKSKIIKKRVDVYRKGEWPIPQVPILDRVEPAVSKKVFDMNMFGKLIQAIWEYYLQTKLKRISSEGSYRPGIGWIKSPNKGISDFMGAYKGITYFVETKQANEAYLKSQAKFQQWADDGGAPYVTIRNFDQMIDFVLSIK